MSKGLTKEERRVVAAEKRRAARDWTRGPDGRSNSSDEYLWLVAEVERLIRSSGATLINGGAASTARLIVSQLAHVHGLRPEKGSARR